MTTTNSKTLRARGYEITVTTTEDGTDVSVAKGGAVVVVGMFGSGMLDLSDFSPTGERVRLSESVRESIEERVCAYVESVENEEADDEDEDEAE